MTAAEGIEYGAMSPDDLVAHLLDDGGLVPFVNLWRLRRDGSVIEQFSWHEMAMHVWSLTRGYWQPTPEYLEGVYWMQAEREAVEA